MRHAVNTESHTHPIEYWADLAGKVDAYPWEDLYTSLLWKLDECVPFTLARYGDGEWAAIFGERGVNCDGHPYYAAMGAALIDALNAPEYLLGVQWLNMKANGSRVAKWLSQRQLRMPWVNGEVFHGASKARQLHRLVECLIRRRVIVVAKDGLDKLPFPHVFIQVPATDVWAEVESIGEQVLNFVNRGDYHPVVLYSASMAAEVIIDRVFNESDNPVTQIDMGSVWDPYLGIQTRRYHKGLDVSIEDLVS